MLANLFLNKQLTKMKIIVEYLSESLNSTPKNFKQFGKAFFDAINDYSEYGW